MAVTLADIQERLESVTPSYGDYKAITGSFKSDLYQAFEVEGNPKADEAYRLAWEYGHSYGYHEVLIYFMDLVDLIK